MTSKNQMAAVAGLLQYPVDELPADGAGADVAEPVVDVFEEAFRHQTFVELSGHISEVSLLISGRQPEIWWPPEAPPPSNSPAQSRPISRQASRGRQASSRQPSFSGAGTQPASPVPGTMHAATAAVSAAAAAGAVPGEVADLVTLEEEVQLISLRFRGAAVSVEVSSDYMRVETLMRSLDIVDLLVGAKCPAKGYMARSTPVNEGGGGSWRCVHSAVPGAADVGIAASESQAASRELCLCADQNPVLGLT
jgi:hypothetical protein